MSDNINEILTHVDKLDRMDKWAFQYNLDNAKGEKVTSQVQGSSAQFHIEKDNDGFDITFYGANKANFRLDMDDVSSLIDQVKSMRSKAPSPSIDVTLERKASQEHVLSDILQMDADKPSTKQSNDVDSDTISKILTFVDKLDRTDKWAFQYNLDNAKGEKVTSQVQGSSAQFHIEKDNDGFDITFYGANKANFRLNMDDVSSLIDEVKLMQSIVPTAPVDLKPEVPVFSHKVSQENVFNTVMELDANKVTKKLNDEFDPGI